MTTMLTLNIKFSAGIVNYTQIPSECLFKVNNKNTTFKC